VVKVVDPPIPVVVVVSVVPVVKGSEVIPVVVVVNGVAVTVAGLDEEEELPAAGGSTKL